MGGEGEGEGGVGSRVLHSSFLSETNQCIPFQMVPLATLSLGVSRF